MKASDIAYLKQIKGGLGAVSEANKEIIKKSLLPFVDSLKNLKKEDGVNFTAINKMDNNEALRLARTNIIIYKDNNNIYIPVEIKNKNKIKIIDEMYENELFTDAIKYTAKTKDELINSAKDLIRNNEQIKKELKNSGISMSKIFNLKTIEEQNEVLKSFGIDYLDKVLEHYSIKSRDIFRTTKEPYMDNWITDNTVKYIKKDYDELKMLLISNPSASQTLSKSKKLLADVEKIIDNNPLSEFKNMDSEINLFFNISNSQMLVLKDEITSLNYNPHFHNTNIAKNDAIKIIKENNLEEKYNLEIVDEISIFQPSDSLEGLKFGLIDYLSYQASMKNEYKMKMQSEEKITKQIKQGF